MSAKPSKPPFEHLRRQSPAKGCPFCYVPGAMPAAAEREKLCYYCPERSSYLTLSNIEQHDERQASVKSTSRRATNTAVVHGTDLPLRLTAREPWPRCCSNSSEESRRNTPRPDYLGRPRCDDQPPGAANVGCCSDQLMVYVPCRLRAIVRSHGLQALAHLVC
jgi:hypothetical protein